MMCVLKTASSGRRLTRLPFLAVCYQFEKMADSPPVAIVAVGAPVAHSQPVPLVKSGFRAVWISTTEMLFMNINSGETFKYNIENNEAVLLEKDMESDIIVAVKRKFSVSAFGLPVFSLHGQAGGPFFKYFDKQALMGGICKSYSFLQAPR